MFYQMAFLAATFFVAGSICLGGALMRIPQYDPKPMGQYIADLDKMHEQDIRAMDKRLSREIAQVRQDSGEGKGQLSRRIDLMSTNLDVLDHSLLEHGKLIDKIGHDLYSHFSLQMKKPKGTRK